MGECLAADRYTSFRLSTFPRAILENVEERVAGRRTSDASSLMTPPALRAFTASTAETNWFTCRICRPRACSASDSFPVNRPAWRARNRFSASSHALVCAGASR